MRLAVAARGEDLIDLRRLLDRTAWLSAAFGRSKRLPPLQALFEDKPKAAPAIDEAGIVAALTGYQAARSAIKS